MRGNLHKQPILRYICIIVIILIVFAVYMAALQPLIAEFCIPPRVHSGTKLYTEKLYLEYENGDKFAGALSRIPLPEDAEVTAFSYYDHCWRDNLFYGKYSDVFVLDLKVNQQYEEIKNYILQNNENNEQVFVENECKMHWLPGVVTTDDCCFFAVVVNDEESIRFILITDYENSFANAFRADFVLLTKFGIDWTQ